MEIQIQNWQKQFKISKSMLRQVLLFLARQLNLRGKELSLVLTDDPQIADLNQRYRNISGPTDVLAFAMQEGEPSGADSEMLGDIVISVDTARRQAEQARHSPEKEIFILLIHGLLHLLGYDHMEEAQALEMRQLESNLLAELEKTGYGRI